jgi:hypothetical protein
MDKIKLIMRFKSGAEYCFECDKYTLKTIGDELLYFSYEGGVGECPIFYRGEDIESIARIGE